MIITNNSNFKSLIICLSVAMLTLALVAGFPSSNNVMQTFLKSNHYEIITPHEYQLWNYLLKFNEKRAGKPIKELFQIFIYDLFSCSRSWFARLYFALQRESNAKFGKSSWKTTEKWKVIWLIWFNDLIWFHMIIYQFLIIIIIIYNLSIQIWK